MTIEVKDWKESFLGSTTPYFENGIKFMRTYKGTDLGIVTSYIKAWEHGIGSIGVLLKPYKQHKRNFPQTTFYVSFCNCESHENTEQAANTHCMKESKFHSEYGLSRSLGASNFKRIYELSPFTNTEGFTYLRFRIVKDPNHKGTKPAVADNTETRSADGANTEPKPTEPEKAETDPADTGNTESSSEKTSRR